MDQMIASKYHGHYSRHTLHGAELPPIAATQQLIEALEVDEISGRLTIPITNLASVNQ